MTEPNKARIDAALRLAEAVDAKHPGQCHYCPTDEDRNMIDALSAYRATLPKLRTRAEVDAERLLNLDAWRANVLSGTELCMRDSILCAERTAPEPDD